MTLRFQQLRKAGLRARFFLSGILALWAAGCQPDSTVHLEKPEGPPTERELSRRIHQFVAANAEDEPEPFIDYEDGIPKAPRVRYKMVAIEGGEFDMGSPPSEPGRKEDEGPVHRVRVSSFWMGKFEITWDQYEPFMLHAYQAGKKPRSFAELLKAKDSELVDWISGPSEIANWDASFGMGTKDFPAVGMTQHGAGTFCQWLSAQTGHFYRLPTEAEWEYACRAESSTAYHFGDDPETLRDFDYFDPVGLNTGYRKIGAGRPNPWGLYDMHGNVIEWCLDQYDPEIYAKRAAAGGVAIDPLVKADRRFPRVVRGGSWYDPADVCRSATRSASHPDWASMDPRQPKSLWWLTDAAWLGFRIVRPLKIPDADEMHELWNSGAVHHQAQSP